MSPDPPASDRDLGPQLRRYVDATAPRIGLDDVTREDASGRSRRRGTLAAAALWAVAATIGVVLLAGRPDPPTRITIPASPGSSSPEASATHVTSPGRGSNATAPDRPAPPPRVMLVGDSVAFSLSFGFEGNRETQRLVSLWNQAQYYCELIAAPRREMNGREIAHSVMCDNWRDDWTAARDQFAPDAVLVSIGPWELFDRRVDGEWLAFGSPELDSLITAQLQEIVTTLGTDRTKLVFLTAPAVDRKDLDASPEWRVDQAWRIEHLNDLIRSVAAAHPDTAAVIEYGPHLCPTPTTCTEDIDGVTVRPDGMHYEASGAAKVAPWIASELSRLLAQTPTPPR